MEVIAVAPAGCSDCELSDSGQDEQPATPSTHAVTSNGRMTMTTPPVATGIRCSASIGAQIGASSPDERKFLGCCKLATARCRSCALIRVAAGRSLAGRPLSRGGGSLFLAVRPEGADHQWRENPPRELSIDLVADERLGWVTGRAEAS